MIENHEYVVENEEIVLKEISKLRSTNYNRFTWWRRFTPKKTQLDPKSPLLNKIKNGDLAFSHYWWQAKYTEMEMNSKKQITMDSNHWVEATTIDRARRKRLYEDFEKDEKGKLAYIRKQFPKEFYMTCEDYDREVELFGGTLSELYNHCVMVYKKKMIIK